MIHLLQTGSERGCRYATLEVRPTNSPALGLYRKLGFRVVGRRRGYYSDTGEDALVMSRTLPAPGEAALQKGETGC
jgi:ribosomal-protein-alanine N-acetyltransferase